MLKLMIILKSWHRWFCHINYLSLTGMKNSSSRYVLILRCTEDKYRHFFVHIHENRLNRFVGVWLCTLVRILYTSFFKHHPLCLTSLLGEFSKKYFFRVNCVVHFLHYTMEKVETISHPVSARRYVA